MKNKMKKLKVRNEGFTIVQLATTLSVLLIIASIAGVAYSSILSRARASACKANLQTLNTAVELYVQEYGVIPAVLGDLKLQHFEKAYARVMEQRSWYTKFSHALLKMNLSDEAYAAFLTYENLKKFGAGKDSFTCPEDDGGTSYGINGNLAGSFWGNVGNDVIVVADCDSATFTSASQLKNRHSSGHVVHAITKGGTLVEFGDDGSVNSDDDDTDDVAFDPDHSDVADNLISEITSLGLATGAATAYTSTLEAVATALEAGDNASAISQLDAFISAVQQDIDNGVITGGNGNYIKQKAGELMTKINT